MHGSRCATSHLSKTVLSAACALMFGAIVFPLSAGAQTAAQNQAQAQARQQAQIQEQNRVQNQLDAQERNQVPDAAPSQPLQLQTPAPVTPTPPALDTTLPVPRAPDTSAGSSVTASEYARNLQSAQGKGGTPEELARAADQDLFQLLKPADPKADNKVIPLPVDSATSALGDDLPIQDRISLEEALERTVNNSYSFKAISAQAEGAGYARKAALGQLGPAVDVRTQRGREFDNPSSVIDPDTGKVRIDYRPVHTYRQQSSPLGRHRPIAATAVPAGLLFRLQKNQPPRRLRRFAPRRRAFDAVLHHHQGIFRYAQSLFHAVLRARL